MKDSSIVFIVVRNHGGGTENSLFHVKFTTYDNLNMELKVKKDILISELKSKILEQD